jgi:hypothetical protein
MAKDESFLGVIDAIGSITMPTFKGLFAMFCACEVDSERSGQLYREIRRKHRKYHDFAIRGARRSRSYVNMVKVGFRIGEFGVSKRIAQLERA